MIRINFTDLQGNHRIRLMYNQDPKEFQHSVRRGILYLYSSNQTDIGFVVINRQGKLENNLIPNEKFNGFVFNVKQNILNVLNDPGREASLERYSRDVLACIVQYSLCIDEDSFYTFTLDEEKRTRDASKDIIVPADWMLQFPGEILPKSLEYQCVSKKLINQLQDEKMLEASRDPIMQITEYKNTPIPGRSFQSILIYTPADTDCYLVGFSRKLGSPTLMCVTRDLLSVENVIKGSISNRIWTWYFTLKPQEFVESLFSCIKRERSFQLDEYPFTDIYGSPITLLWGEIGRVLQNFPEMLLHLIANYAVSNDANTLASIIGYAAKETHVSPTEESQRSYFRDHQIQQDEKSKLQKNSTTTSPGFFASNPTVNSIFNMIVSFKEDKYPKFKDLINNTDPTLVGNLLSQIQLKIASFNVKELKKETMTKDFKRWVNRYFSETPLILFQKEVITFTVNSQIDISPYMAKAAELRKQQPVEVSSVPQL